MHRKHAYQAEGYGRWNDLGQRPRILIVDDDESIRNVLAAILREKGYAVDTAGSGNEAIEKSNAVSFNLTLMDVRLPDMEGTKLLATMRETTPRMIKIIITGYPSLPNAVDAVNENADAYILKPLDVEHTLEVIEDHLLRQHENRAFDEEKVAEFIETRARELKPIRRHLAGKK